ncbi:hypothetical protein TURU_023539 [Turdus rufiventris]|nr:hypothetical protein TURU_023539 [Turdus rufiventris]
MYPGNKRKKLWREEKERLLKMTLEERRKEYLGDYVALKAIPTWMEDLKSKSESDGENAKEDLQGKKSLSEKVSLYRGDITLLEVDAIVNAGFRVSGMRGVYMILKYLIPNYLKWFAQTSYGCPIPGNVQGQRKLAVSTSKTPAKLDFFEVCDTVGKHGGVWDASFIIELCNIHACVKIADQRREENGKRGV